MTRRRPAAAAARRPRAVAEPLETRALLSATVAFATAVSFAAGTAPDAIATADFNGDGNADLAVTDATAQQVDILYGTGTGTFTAGPLLSLSAPPTAIVTGDFNGDGRPDLAVACSPGSANTATTVTVFLDTAAGTFGTGIQTSVEANSTPTEPIDIATADFNGDGHLDIVATESANSAVGILLGTGTGTFAAPVVKAVGELPTAVVTGDFNADGKADVAVTATLTQASGTSSGASSDGVLTLLGGGNGQFSAGSITALSASGSNALAVGDLTGDGKAIDLAVGNDDGTVTVLANQGGGTFVVGADQSVAAGSTGIAVADFNLDGHGDVVTTDGGTALSSGADEVTVLPGTGTGTVGTAGNFPVGTLPQGVVVADFNGDGKPDVAVADEGSGTVSVLLNSTVVTTIATKTTLAADVSTAPAGSPVNLTATVKPSSTSTLTGESFPTGKVSFYDGTTLLGTAAVAAGTAANTGVATLAVTTLTVGTHRLTAKYGADTAYAASASTATTEVVTATSTEGPDLVATFASVTLPATVAPGEAGSARVTITNQGTSTATGSITNGLYLSLDDMYDANDTPVAVKGALAKANLKLTANKSITLAGTFAVPTDVPLGTYVLLVQLNTNGGVSESSTANNVTASPTAYTVADQFGTVGGKKGVALQLADGSGTVGTFKMSGPGTGELDVGDHGVDLTLSGTSAASAITITTAGGATFHLHDASAGATIGTLRAPSVDVTDALDLGASATAVTLGDLSGATLSAAGGIKSLSVSSFTAGTLTASYLGTLKVTGAFGATTTLNGSAAPRGIVLQSATIGGDDTATLNATGTVGTLLVKGQVTGATTIDGGGLKSFGVQGAMTGTVSAAEGTIGAVSALGAVGANVTFTAAAFPKRAILAGVPVDPATDSHFVLTPVPAPLIA